MFQTSFDTDCPPDSIEWCPTQSDLFACATYLYHPDSTSREGSIYLLKYNDSMNTIDVVQHKKTEGILDLKWLSYVSDKTLFSAVTAQGQLSIYILPDISEPSICEEVTNDQTIALSHSWLHLGQSYVLISDQKGHLSVCDFDHNSNLRFSQSWLAHDYECWTCDWDASDPNLVYSGADDTFFKVWDIRNYQRPVHVNKKHTMGVCSIMSDESNKNEFYTGSFDEYLRLWDKRQMTTPLKEIKLGGGVWKIKASPFDKDILLCACMQHGFVLVDLKTSTIPCVYQNHTSLAYGCDWQRSDSMHQLTELMDVCMQNELKPSPGRIIASCSFYDKVIHIWKSPI